MVQTCDCNGKYQNFLVLVYPVLNQWTVGGGTMAQPCKVHLLLAETGTETTLLYDGAINFSSSLGSLPN